MKNRPQGATMDTLIKNSVAQDGREDGSKSTRRRAGTIRHR